jgi:hypothetical protein
MQASGYLGDFWEAQKKVGLETDWTQEFLILLNRDHEAIFREWWQTETLSFLYPFLSQHIIGDGGVGSNGHRQGLHRRTMAG